MKIIARLSIMLLFLLSSCESGALSETSPPLTERAVLPSATHQPSVIPSITPGQTHTPISSPTVLPTPAILATPSGSGGAIVAYTSIENNNVHVYLINADGSGRTQLTSSARDGVEPSWSPDGTQLVFQNNGLWIADFPTGEISLLPISTILPNRWLVKPAWSPNGEWIAFNNENGTLGDIYLIRPDGTGLQRITDTGDISRDGALVWSPSGEKIAFSANRNGMVGMYILDVAEALKGVGEETQLLLSDVTHVDERVDLISSWSPDGSRIAFSSNRDGNPEIYVVNIDGSDIVRITNNPAFDKDPAWSPDGEKIAFSSSRNGSFDLYVVTLGTLLGGTESSSIQRLTSAPGDETCPAWISVP